MPLPDSAFRHHPELKGLVEDPATSFFRDLDFGIVREHVRAAGKDMDWFRPCDEREALRRQVLSGRQGTDIWIFAFGSLMWNPAIYVTEIRAARAEGYWRDFCLSDDTGRGSPECPNLMAGLDLGGSCDGYALRIAADAVEEETRQLFRREMISYGYRSEFITCDTAHGPVDALTFLIDRDHPRAACGLEIETQAQMIAVAEGMLGPAVDYIGGIVRHLDLMGVRDERTRALYERVVELRAARGTATGT